MTWSSMVTFEACRWEPKSLSKDFPTLTVSVSAATWLWNWFGLCQATLSDLQKEGVVLQVAWWKRKETASLQKQSKQSPGRGDKPWIWPSRSTDALLQFSGWNMALLWPFLKSDFCVLLKFESIRHQKHFFFQVLTDLLLDDVRHLSSPMHAAAVRGRAEIMQLLLSTRVGTEILPCESCEYMQRSSSSKSQLDSYSKFSYGGSVLQIWSHLFPFVVWMILKLQ